MPHDPAVPNGRANFTIKELPLDARPREKLKALGAGSLSESELLAIILRVGTQGESVVDLANRLLVTYGGLVGLSRVSFPELCGVHGLGEAKACQLKAALELGRRLLLAQPEERLQVRSPADLAPLLMLEMAPLDQETLRVVLLNTRNQVIKFADVYRGSLNSSLVRVAEVFKEAVRVNAAAIIVAHNHPSGDPTPSPEDRLVTEQIVSAGKLLEIEVLDHLVIGERRYVSMREKRLGFRG
ncbi:MAG TPA: DNA repair protein RadC [Chloroflexia bacterium]|jgi:DNA repair protein RadC|nr:DNA repair protein RadC [Chloroflexia bacterium]